MSEKPPWNGDSDIPEFSTYQMPIVKQPYPSLGVDDILIPIDSETLPYKIGMPVWAEIAVPSNTSITLKKTLAIVKTLPKRDTLMPNMTVEVDGEEHGVSSSSVVPLKPIEMAQWRKYGKVKRR